MSISTTFEHTTIARLIARIPGLLTSQQIAVAVLRVEKIVLAWNQIIYIYT